MTFYDKITLNQGGLFVYSCITLIASSVEESLE